MADDKTILTPQQMEIGKKWINDHKVDAIVCPICKTSNWNMADRLVRMGLWGPDPYSITAAYPQIYLICQKCGNGLFIHASPTGILNPESDTTAQGKESSDA